MEQEHQPSAAELADLREELYVLLMDLQGEKHRQKLQRIIRRVEAQLDQAVRDEESRATRAP
jgi:hypothetical protein